MNTILLRSGAEVEMLGVDEDSGWPLIEIPGIGLVAVDPVEIQEGWNDRDD